MLMRLLRSHLRPYRRPLLAVVALQLVSTLAALSLPSLNARIIDDGIATGDTGAIMRIGGVMLGVTVVQIACSIGAVWFGARTAMAFGRDVRGSVFSRVGSFSAQEMARFEIVKKFVDQGGRARLVETSEFSTKQDHGSVSMLGTYSPVPSLEWAVIAQKDQHQAYASVYEMQRYSRLLALMAVLLSVGISSVAARTIAKPLEQLTISSRAIANGDFSQRVHITSRTEIGELASTFNHMTEDLERFDLLAFDPDDELNPIEEDAEEK